MAEQDKLTAAAHAASHLPAGPLELGSKSTYDATYNPDRLLAVPRVGQRQTIAVAPGERLFYGYDHWNHYEVSWLNRQGKPVVATAEIIYDCHSPNLIESKTMKLYFNSFNNTAFTDAAEVTTVIQRDLTERVGAAVWVKLLTSDHFTSEAICPRLKGIVLDDLDVACSVYTVDPTFLITENIEVEETVYSDLLKSICLVTGQPDWGSVQIAYRGKKIVHEGLLRYIVSFRNHPEFAEHCIERIFMDILRRCQPTSLTVHGCYTRRGGLDINPYRSTQQTPFPVRTERLWRQ